MQPKANRQAFRVALIYVIVAACWILFSDKLAGSLFHDPAVFTRVAIAKGWVFVLATGGLLYFSIRQMLRNWEREADARKRTTEQLRQNEEKLRLVAGTKRLTRVGFACDFASSAAEATEALRTKEYDVLLSDIHMPGNAGLELIASIPDVCTGLPIILLTGYPSVATATRSVQLRIMAYLSKPPDFDELCRLLHAAVVERRNLRVLKDSRQRLQDWDREIERIQQLLQQVPNSDRHSAMQSYLRLTLRHLVVSLIEFESLLLGDGERLGTDPALEKQELLNALRKAVGVLQKTKDHFKSKELGDLRKELEILLG